jgi:hypothetical protein
MNIEARVKVSGKLVSKEKLKRSKRHAFSGPELLQQDYSSGKF